MSQVENQDNRGGGRTAAFHTLGCRVNAYETEAMLEQLRAEGYRIVPFDTPADVYVVNTCTVTSIADRKSRQMLHRAREMNPDGTVVAVGCYAENAGGMLEEDPAIDLIIGNNAKSHLASVLDRYYEGDLRRIYTEPIGDVRGYEELVISGAEGRTRAFIKIQDGCNEFCSYCMIPYVRGRVRSRKPQDVMAEAERLAKEGYKEIILTGIHMSAYGMDFEADGRIRRVERPSEAKTNLHLLGLIRDIASIPEITRVRMGSLEPGIMTEEFVSAIASLPEVCPQFHLSLQSGSDTVLARMNRRYTADEYRNICLTLRQAYGDPAITTDLIVGFPGETEAEFRETLDFVSEIGFAKIHIFRYSVRRGTRAASMPGQVPSSLIRERMQALEELEKTMRTEYAGRRVGTEQEVLFEERKVLNGMSGMSGHTREALDAFFVTEELSEGRICTLRAAGMLADGTLVVESY